MNFGIAPDQLVFTTETQLISIRNYRDFNVVYRIKANDNISCLPRFGTLGPLENVDIQITLPVDLPEKPFKVIVQISKVPSEIPQDQIMAFWKTPKKDVFQKKIVCFPKDMNDSSFDSMDNSLILKSSSIPVPKNSRKTLKSNYVIADIQNLKDTPSDQSKEGLIDVEATLKSQLALLHDEADDMSKLIKQLNSTIEDQQSKIDFSSKELVKAKDYVILQKEKIKSLDIAWKASTFESEARNSELEILKLKLQEAQNQIVDFSEKETALLRKLEAERSKNEELCNDLDQARLEKMDNREAEAMKLLIGDLKATIEDLESSNHDKENEIAKQKVLLNQIELEYEQKMTLMDSSSTRRCRDYETQIEVLKQNAQELENNLFFFESNATVTKSEYEEIVTKNENLVLKVAAAELEIEKLEKLNSSVSEKIILADQITQENDILRTRNVNLEKSVCDFRHLEDQLHEERLRNIQLTADLDNSRANEKVQRELQNLSIEYTAMLEKVQELQTKDLAFRSTIKDLNSQKSIFLASLSRVLQLDKNMDEEALKIQIVETIQNLSMNASIDDTAGLSVLQKENASLRQLLVTAEAQLKFVTSTSFSAPGNGKEVRSKMFDDSPEILETGSNLYDSFQQAAQRLYMEMLDLKIDDDLVNQAKQLQPIVSKIIVEKQDTAAQYAEAIKMMEALEEDHLALTAKNQSTELEMATMFEISETLEAEIKNQQDFAVQMAVAQREIQKQLQISQKENEEKINLLRFMEDKLSRNDAEKENLGEKFNQLQSAYGELETILRQEHDKYDSLLQISGRLFDSLKLMAKQLYVDLQAGESIEDKSIDQIQGFIDILLENMADFSSKHDNDIMKLDHVTKIGQKLFEAIQIFAGYVGVELPVM